MAEGTFAFQHEYDLAVATAREAGELLRSWFGRVLDVRFKGVVDPVTEADREAEQRIAGRLLDAFPGDRIIGEEGTASGQNTASERSWIIDPLDGTVNFTHGYPIFCVSIGFQFGDVVQAGVVYDPMRDELFAARRGMGATLNGVPLRVSQTSEMLRAMLCTGFAYDVDLRTENLAHFARFVDITQAVRRDGSAALDLAYVGCGRFDGYWERGVQAWDVAAAGLIVLESGGKVTGYAGQPFDPFSREIVASNGELHEAMLGVIGNVAAARTG